MATLSEKHIGQGEREPRLAPVMYHETRCRCPRCNAPNPPIRHTEPKTDDHPVRVRSHRCRECGQRFKSVPSE